MCRNVGCCSLLVGCCPWLLYPSVTRKAKDSFQTGCSACLMVRVSLWRPLTSMRILASLLLLVVVVA